MRKRMPSGRGAGLAVLLIAALLFASALAGCAPKGDSAEEKQVQPTLAAQGASEGAASVDATASALTASPAATSLALTSPALAQAAATTADAISSDAAVDESKDAPKESGKKDTPKKDGKQKSSTSDDKKKKDAKSGKEKKKAKDEYQTDPTPPGKPTPTEPQEQNVDKAKTYSCTLYIGCETILDNMDALDPAKKDIVPKDGVVYKKKTVQFNKGESVFDVLVRETRSNSIHMEFVNTPMYNSAYIEGIANIYEFDCGNLSGWMYNVNGWYPNYGCSRYEVQDGDSIEWRYTCDLGQDLGAEIS